MASMTLRPRVGLMTARPSVSARRASPRVVTVKALGDTQLVISAATAGSLALGRFVFLPFQRDNVKRQGLGKQNGVTAAEAGDKFAQEASFAMNTNDPAGFNLIDVFAWGAIGHALGFFALATNSLNAAGFDPKPF